MLVITRKVDQSIYIGDHIKITVIAIKGSAVRIGIEAPADVVVLREEIAGLPPKAARPPEISATVTARKALARSPPR